MTPQPYLIGIAGPSCSGKSEVARRVAEKLGASVVGLDSYYRELGHLSLERRNRVNFDAPEALDHELLCSQIHRLACGEDIEKPIYDFSTHTRIKQIEHIPATRFIIVEGLFALHWSRMRSCFGTKVYLTADHKTCYARRLARDVSERGRTPQSVEEQYRETVRPMCEKYIVPTAHFADLIISGTGSLDVSVRAVLSHIERHVSAQGELAAMAALA